jgi:carboxymethylenebutenolidase
MEYTKTLSKTFFVALSLCFAMSCKQQNKENNQQEELGESPRHHEWVDFKREDGTVMKAFVAYPEVSEAADAVVVIHENRGLNDWARSFADELAQKGYLVIAPDLISNTVEGVEKTTDFTNTDLARQAIYDLDPDAVTADLNAVFEYIKEDPASTGTVSVAGFCWGGSNSFRFATNQTELKNSFVFYGTAPTNSEDLARINCPVYGFYGGNDNRVNSTLKTTQTQMDSLGHFFEPVIYEEATHAFMRKGAQTEEGPDKVAHDKAWERLLALLKA